MDFKGSRTEQNLLAAFSGESMARNKYLFFAEKARQEHQPEVAELFEKMAQNEGVHGRLLYQHLKGVGNSSAYIFFGNRSHIGATLPSAPSMLFRCSKKKDRPPKGSLSFLSHLRKKVSYLDERIRIKSFNLILTNVKGRSIL